MAMAKPSQQDKPQPHTGEQRSGERRLRGVDSRIGTVERRKAIRFKNSTLEGRDDD
jgi:hypothetical protein